MVRAQAVLHDLSAGGLSLRLRNGLPHGTLLAVEALDPAAAPLPVALVVRCVSAGGHWHVGCTLARLLTEDELRFWLG
jgi:hypothetical protein